MKSSMRENVKKFDMKKYTASWTKMRDLRHNLTHVTAKSLRHKRREDDRNRGGRATFFCWHASAHRFMLRYEDRSVSSYQVLQRVFDGDIRSSHDVCAP